MVRTPPGNYPKRIVLSTSREIKFLQRQMATLTDAAYDLDEFGSILVSALTYRDNIARYGSEFVQHYVKQHEDPEERKRVEHAVSAVFEMVVRQVTELNLWVPTGELNYVFDQWLVSGDMVLQQFPY